MAKKNTEAKKGGEGKKSKEGKTFAGIPIPKALSNLDVGSILASPLAREALAAALVAAAGVLATNKSARDAVGDAAEGVVHAGGKAADSVADAGGKAARASRSAVGAVVEAAAGMLHGETKPTRARRVPAAGPGPVAPSEGDE